MEARLVLAVILAPMIAATVWSLGVHVWDWYAKPYDAAFSWSSALVYGLAATCLGIGVTSTLGLAAHTLLRGFQQAHWLAYTLAGLISGATLCVLSGTAFGWAPLTIHWIPLSVIAAVAFWLIRRPDRDTPANPPTSAP